MQQTLWYEVHPSSIFIYPSSGQLEFTRFLSEPRWPSRRPGPLGGRLLGRHWRSPTTRAKLNEEVHETRTSLRLGLKVVLLEVYSDGAGFGVWAEALPSKTVWHPSSTWNSCGTCVDTGFGNCVFLLFRFCMFW